MRRRWGWVIGVTAAVLVVGLGLAWSYFHVPSAPGAPSANRAVVIYYPACGNEVLEYDGTTWYPIQRPDWEAPIFDDPTESPTATASGASGGAGGHGLGTSRAHVVAAPGPGDDRGTLVIYDNGVAYFMSDSGDIATWLTTAPQTYNWVC